MKIAAIDIGSNSVHMIIASTSAGRAFEVIDRVKEMVFLGRSMAEHGRLTDEAFAAGLEAIGKFHKLALRHGVDEILAVATAAVREAENGGEFLYAVAAQTGITPQVISGVEEARYIYLAVKNVVDLFDRSALIIDIGGGSVEVIVGNARELQLGKSLRIGVQRLRAKFGGGALGKREKKDLESHVREVSEAAMREARAAGFGVAVGTSGTILALGEAVSRGGGERPTNTGHVVKLDGLRQLADELAARTPAERVQMFGIDVARSDSIHVGGLLLCTLLELAGAKEITLSDSSLREGVVLDYLDRAAEHIRAFDVVSDIRRASVLELAQRCGQTGAHPGRVAGLALELFDQTRDLHGLRDSDRRLLEYAAILHDVGQHVGYERHEHHAAYIIRNGDLRGFDDKEREMIALVARYHRKSRPRRKDSDYDALSPRRRKSVRVLSGILRLADGLDRSHHQLVHSVRCRYNERELGISAIAEDDAELEVWGARRKAKLLERALGRKITLYVEPVSRAAQTA
jgi:exopolyphosphatase / guanosine-5'-triphosphate,3'-diphosphate pyrophosphatase